MARFENPAVRNRERNMSGAVVAVPGKSRPGDRGAAVGWSMRRMFARMVLGLFGTFAWAAESEHTVPYVPSAAAEVHAGVVRIESRSASPGEVRVLAVDDAGQRIEAGRLALGAGAAVEFEIGAMESGDASLGLAGTGPGEGDWRLELSTELDIEARAYARSEGFLAVLHDAALASGESEVEVPMFHAGGEARSRSVLRLANAGGGPATVRVRGVDDGGRAGGPVTVELAAWEARGYTASELESGTSAGLSGSLGDGSGKWRLRLSAERGSAYATHLLEDGSLLSSVPGGMSRGARRLHRVALFPSASDGGGRRGVVRVVNRSAEPAEVSIEAFDSTDRSYEEVRLRLGAGSSSEFDSSDLEQGDAEKDLTGSTGPGEGDWWLELSSASDIAVLSYVDTASGPLSALRGTSGVETETGMRYEAVLLGGSSALRLLNADADTVEVRLTGTDDAGAVGGVVELTVEPWSVRTLTREALAEGEAGLRGALGSGTGSWRLRLEADGEIDVLSLVRGAGGMLSDVSRRGRPAGAPPRTEVVDATASSADLWVRASASARALSPGEAFELTATVGNRGRAVAPATTLRYRRSADAAITASDTEVGADAVAALGPAGSSAASLTLNAPSEPGTHYYGACVDAVAEETNTANNCSAAVAVAVAVEARPDLVVTVDALDGTVEPAERFTLRATVRNAGVGAASATTLRYYFSSDNTISTTDTQLGTDPVAALGPAGSSAASLTLYAPTAPGTYHYGACVDAVAEETNTANNCSAAVAVAVEARPDLVVTVDALDGTVEPAERFTLRATVRNAGVGAASATTLRYYSSSDNTISTTDTQLGTDPVAALGPAGSSAASLTLYAPTAPGTYHYGACVDAVAEETNTANNCSAAVAVAVEARPDLVVTVDALDGMVEPAERFTLRATVRNAGVGAASATTLRYYSSSDNTISTTDTQLGTDPVAALGPAGSSAASLTLYAPTAPGTYHYGACVDAVPDESNVRNNCSAAVGVEVAQSATYYGAVTARNGYRRRACSSFWGLVTDRESELEAKRLAAEACREKVPEDDGPPHLTCRGRAISFRHCAAVATGYFDTPDAIQDCLNLQVTAESRSAAEAFALKVCSEGGYGTGSPRQHCIIVASACNSTRQP